MAVTSYLGLGLLDGHCLLAAVNHQPAAANHQPSTACLSATACLRYLPTICLPATAYLPICLPATACYYLAACLPACHPPVHLPACL